MTTLVMKKRHGTEIGIALKHLKIFKTAGFPESARRGEPQTVSISRLRVSPGTDFSDLRSTP